VTGGPKDTASSKGSDPVNPADLIDALRPLLAAVERGEMTGSATMIAWLEGALSALEALAGEPK